MSSVTPADTPNPNTHHLPTNRKTRLIDAIHQCQVARLHIANFRKEAEYLLQQLELMTNYLGALPGGDDPDANIAQRVSSQ